LWLDYGSRKRKKLKKEKEVFQTFQEKEKIYKKEKDSAKPSALASVLKFFCKST